METIVNCSQCKNKREQKQQRSLMPVRSYWFYQAVLWAIAIPIFRRFCYRVSPSVGKVGSEIVFWTLGIGLCFLITWIMCRKNRTFFQICFNILLPLDLYLIISNGHGMRNSLWAWLILTAISTILILCFTFLRTISQNQSRRRVIRNRILFAISRIQAVACVLFALCLGVHIVSMMSLTPVEETAFAAAGDKGVEQRYKNTFTNLEHENWVRMNNEERLRVLEKIVEIERGKLGIKEDAPKLCMGEMESPGVLGCYTDKTNEIKIATDVLATAPPETTVFIVCHEMAHCFQYSTIRALHRLPARYQSLELFKNTRQYDRELGNYVTAEDDNNAYHNQSCEKDANLYGKEEVEYYAQWIESWQDFDSIEHIEGDY